jgi:nitrogen PTS system EIIA component
MVDLGKLIDRGGVFFNIRGSGPEDVISELIRTVRLPESLQSDAILQAVLERESLAPTAVGHGIAIPHPRNPMCPGPEEERIVVAYAKEGIPFRALDKQPVYVLFLILSATQKSHLQMLSQLSFLFHDKDFRKILELRPDKQELVQAIKALSKAWE